MTKKRKSMEIKKSERTNSLITPKLFRRELRLRKNALQKRRNDGQTVGHGQYVIGFGHFAPIHIPKEGSRKFKGYMRENRKYSKIS